MCLAVCGTNLVLFNWWLPSLCFLGKGMTLNQRHHTWNTCVISKGDLLMGISEIHRSGFLKDGNAALWCGFKSILIDRGLKGSEGA